MIVIKKYGNRRLYDTEQSRYITLEELTETIRGGADVRVVDAKTHEDLTQATLTQIIMESRGASKLLPVPLLTQLIRLNDEALSEFLGRYLSGALELYLQARHGAQTAAPWNPFAMLPFNAASLMARAFNAPPAWAPEASVAPQQSTAPNPARADDVEELRRELAELKRSLRKRRK